MTIIAHEHFFLSFQNILRLLDEQAAGPPYPKPGGPTQMEDAVRRHKLAAQYHDLKNQCQEQVSTLYVVMHP